MLRLAPPFLLPTPPALPVVRTALVCAALLLSIGCGGANGDAQAPRPTIAQSLDAQHAFEHLRNGWEATPAGRKTRMWEEASRFVRSFSDDPLAAKAAVYQAFIALEAQRYRQAIRLARPALHGPPGNTRDMAMVVEALARQGLGHGDAAARLEKLAPKLLDPFVYEQALVGLIHHYLGTKDWKRAVRTMGYLLQGASEVDQPVMRAKVRGWLRKVPDRVLHRLRDEQERRERGEEPGWWNEQLARLVDKRLRHPVELAGEEGASDQQEPSRRRLRKADWAPLVLVLQGDGATAMRRSAELAAGLMSVLGPDRDGPRFESVAASGSNELSQLCDAVAGRAGVLFGGVTPGSARVLRSCARRHPELAVVSAVEPGTGNQSAADMPNWLVLTRTDEALRSAWVEATRRHPAALVVHVTDSAHGDQKRWSCDKRALMPPPVQRWVEEDKQAIAVDGSSGCARAVILAVGEHPGARKKLEVWVGLEGAVGLGPVPSSTRGRVWVAQAARVRFAPEKGVSDPRLREWYASHGRSPTLFEALGHDLAALSLQAWNDTGGRLAPRSKDGNGSWSRALREARSAELWSTSRHGFGRRGRLGRSIVFQRAAQRSP